MANTMLHTLLALTLLVGSAQAACPFASIWDLTADLGQYPRNWIDEIADKNPGKPLVVKKWMEPKYSKASDCTAKQYQAIAQEIVAAVAGDNATQSAPTVQRLSFHTCGGWSQSAQNGGCNGAWHAYPEDLDFSENRGIEGVVAWLKDLKKTKFKCITLADLFTFAGVVAQEAVGGPPTAWYPGRLDALAPGPRTVPFSARLPDGMMQPQGIMYNFLNYGMTVREIVALIGGGHSFGGADPTTTGWDGSFTAYGDAWPPKGQDNVYFKTLLDLEWTPYVVNETKRVQLVPAPGQKTEYAADNGKMVFRLPSDYALRAAPTFAYWARKYADNNTLFVQDYQRIYQRTLQLGAGITWTPRTSFKWRGLKDDFEGYGPLLEPNLDPADFSNDGGGVLPGDMPQAEVAATDNNNSKGAP